MQMVEEIARDFPELKDAELYKGKVRANFTEKDFLVTPAGILLRLIVTTDQISTHDKVRGLIPLKSQITNAISNFMFDLIAPAMPNAQLSVPGASVVISEECKPVDVEFVFRGYVSVVLFATYSLKT